eukprot:4488519-Pyramimonas_sp.AAC.1
MLSHRRRLRAAAGSAKRGRCLTSLLALRLPGDDAGAALPRLCLNQCLDSWLRVSRLRASVQLARGRTLAALKEVPVAQRSRHVR